MPVGPNQTQIPPYSSASSGLHYQSIHTSDLISRAQLTSSADQLVGLPSQQSYLPTASTESLESSLQDTHSLVGGGENGPVALVQEAARKREVRLLKNREAARECRRKKKEYIKCLENRVQILEQQNKDLIGELQNLKEMYCHTQP